MKPAPSPAFHDCRNERGVALIIVLGFLGLMVMMAVAFMVQARVERMVADSTLDGMRARQIAQTGIAAAIQDYMNESLEQLIGGKQPPEMFLSGDSSAGGYLDSNIRYGSTNLWNGEARDWLPSSLTDSDSSVDINEIDDMKWVWVRQDPNHRTRILGRYAYACFSLSGGVDANLLGRDFGENLPSNGYGAQTNRNNVRKMLLNGVRATPSTDTGPQLKLARYQSMWQGFDTPAALNKLTDGVSNTGGDDKDRWAQYDMDERTVGTNSTDHLSCYSYAATHRGAGTKEKKPCTVENILGSPFFTKLVRDMGAEEKDVRNALEDYFDSSNIPKGTDYPSVKAVPMFNEIMVKLELVGDGKQVQLKVTLKPEFWCPFPSKNTGGSYELEAPTIGGGEAQGGSQDIWIRARARVPSGTIHLTLTQTETPPPLTVEPKSEPYSPGEFVYTLNVGGMEPTEDGTEPSITAMQMQVAAVNIQKPLELKSGGKAVDATPSDKPLSIAITPPMLACGTSGATTGAGCMEVDDPRLNHLAARWTASSEGSMGQENPGLAKAKNVAKAKMGYEPGKYMYCRNGAMLSPAELGYIPVYNGSTPWMTLDIFSDNGIELMNTLVCTNDGSWDIMDKYDVFYTNGTINPYTRDTAVLNGAFYGLDAREVPDMPGNPNATTEVIGAPRAKAIAEQLVKDKAPDGGPFSKAGPGGWTRVLRYKGFDLNKNERVALAHNTWGLFNESDSLFLVFVVAQSITEGPKTAGNDIGDWDKDDDMITGERWAIALCWMDTSADATGKDAADGLTQEMDIIMFKYLNE